MRAAVRTLKTALVISLAAAGGCQKNQPAQNIAIDNATTPAEIEALPPDESSSTPSNELINGADNADVADLNAAENSD
jgi:hypothetical protein